MVGGLNMKMDCPHCGVNGTVDDSLVGRKVKCPKCLNTFTVQAEVKAPIAVNAMDLEEYELGDAVSDEKVVLDLDDEGLGLELDNDEELDLELDDDEVHLDIDVSDVTGEDEDDVDVHALLQSYEDERLDSQQDVNEEEFPAENCAGCGKAVHPALMMDVDSKLYCAGCVPEHLLDDEDELDETFKDLDDFDPSPSLASELEETAGDEDDEDDEGEEKKGPSWVLKLLLLFLIIALVGSAALVFWDIKIFEFVR